MKEDAGFKVAAIVMSVMAAVCLVIVHFWQVTDNHKTFMTDLEAGNIYLDKIHVEVNGGCGGTVISTEQRLVVTAYHCVQNDLTSKEISIKQYSAEWVDERKDTAEVIAFDKDSDLAVLHVFGTDLALDVAAPLLPESEWTKVQRGQSAWVIGNPLFTYGYLTHGIVSRVTYDFGVMSNLVKSWQFQYDGGVTNGNSGGGMLDDEGRLIGVLSYVYYQPTSRGGTYTNETFNVSTIGGATSIMHLHALLRDNNLKL